MNADEADNIAKDLKYADTQCQVGPDVSRAQQLRDKLYLAAKKSKTRRFHQLYDKVYRMDILEEAWVTVKRNKGVGGSDGVEIEDIIESGETRYLQELQEVLTDTHNYHPRPVKRVNIPKPGGGERPLGIPAIRDRIVQTAAKSLLEPIFEADFFDCSYGYRPGRTAHEALEEIRQCTNKGHKYVLDADIKGYFDSINHEKLLGFVHQRISDRKILKLIRKWLKAGIVSEDGLHENEMGTPQGGVISPLLANIYLHELDKFWTQQTIVKGKLIRFSDDFVILFASRKDAEKGLELVKEKLRELNLQLNLEKTRIVDMHEGKEGFDFLGFYHRQAMSWKYKKHYTQKWPKKSAVKAVKVKIREMLGSRSILLLPLEEVIGLVNPLLRGWMNYFRHGNSSKVFSVIDKYVHQRLALWWSKKHGRSGRRWGTDFTTQRCLESGIIRLTGNIRYWSAV
jgi:group II intron reverse transcriptase/maturase